MFTKPIIDKQIPEYTDDDLRRLSRWRLKMRIFITAMVLLMIGAATLWMLLAPARWSKLAKTGVAILIAGMMSWLILIIDDNIKYRNRKARQASMIKSDPENLRYQLES